MKQKKKIGIFIQWGFHELRSVVLSGLAKELNAKHEAIIYTFNKNSKLYESYLNEAGCSYQYLDKNLFKGSSSKIDAINQSVRKAYMRINGVGNFRNYTKPEDLSPSDYLKGNKLIWTLFSFLTRKTLAVTRKNNDLTQFFKNEGLTDILMAGYSNINNEIIAFSAQAANIKIWSLVNSWKDLYSNDFVSFTPEGLFTWSDNMTKNYIRHNPHLRDKVITIGNPAFDVFLKFRPSNDISFYQEKYNIKQGAKIFVYTMINPLVTQEEHLTIKLIYGTLSQHLKMDWHLLIRKNPLHHAVQYTDLERLGKVSFMQHYWEWDAKKDLAVQEKDGETEWYDIIYYSTCNISVASTVSMEFLILNKPVINVSFNGTGEEDENLRRFSEAPYYKSLCTEPNVFIAGNIKEFTEIITNFPENYIFDSRFQLSKYFKSDQPSIYYILPS